MGSLTTSKSGARVIHAQNSSQFIQMADLAQFSVSTDVDVGSVKIHWLQAWEERRVYSPIIMGILMPGLGVGNKRGLVLGGSSGNDVRFESWMGING